MTEGTEIIKEHIASTRRQRTEIINSIKKQVELCGGEQEMIKLICNIVKEDSLPLLDIIKTSRLFDNGLDKVYRLIAEYIFLFFLTYEIKKHPDAYEYVIAKNLNTLDFGCPIVQDILDS